MSDDTQKRKVIGISSLEFNPVGARTMYLISTAKAAMMKGNRRATRTKTLDGGAVVYDAGFAVADLTWDLSVRIVAGTETAFMAMLVKTYNLIRVCTEDGVFDGVPYSWNETNNIATIQVLVMEQIA